MQLCKFFKLMIIGTIAALSYIHMQMQIIDLAYQGNQREQQIKKLIEENGDATYRILMLKSANHLGLAMLDGEPEMQFADSRDIIRIAASDDLLNEAAAIADAELAVKTSPLKSLFSFGVVAEAKSADKK